jgi:uncharacterized membrane protein YeaQ/YmgE (transglycosylase-associated protein family)
MDLSSLAIELVTGLVGGNLAGALNKSRSLGPRLNSVLGAIGGVGGGTMLGGAFGPGATYLAATSLACGALPPLLLSLLRKRAAPAPPQSQDEVPGSPDATRPGPG